MIAPHPFQSRITRGELTDVCRVCGVNIRRHGLDPDPVIHVDPEAVIARAAQTWIVDRTDDGGPELRGFVMWLLTGEERDRGAF